MVVKLSEITKVSVQASYIEQEHQGLSCDWRENEEEEEGVVEREEVCWRVLVVCWWVLLVVSAWSEESL